MGWDPAVVPDPQDPATYERSKLDWSERDTERGARMLAVYRDLARLRREEPALTDPAFATTSCTVDEESRVLVMARGDLRVVVNFGEQPARVELGDEVANLLFDTGSPVELDGHHATVPGHAGAVVRVGAVT